MLHPYVILKKSKIHGNGLFAKRKIPKGTVIVLVSKIGKDVRVYTKVQYDKFSKSYKAILKKYAYEWEGNLYFCTDNVKYLNHSCEPNISNFNDFDIAIKDIKAGEELTYDYGLILPKWVKPLRCNCGSKNCRKIIRRESKNSRVVIKLNSLARNAAKNLFKIKQPLLQKK